MIPDETSEMFSKAQRELARFAAAMGHPARIALVGLLLRDGEKACGELVEELPLAQATVSQHLKALLEAGVVTVREEGPRRLYRLERGQIRSFCDAMQVTLGRKKPRNPVKENP
jgi:DNA-binding transcriptional ArsR family regulator